MKRPLIHLLAAVAGGLLLVAVLYGAAFLIDALGRGTIVSLDSGASPPASGTFVDHVMLGQLRPWMFLAGFVSTLAARLSPTPARRRRY